MKLSKNQKDKIDLTPPDKRNRRTKSDMIVDDAERITRKRADGTIRDARGRKTRREARDDKKLKEMERASNLLMQTSLTSLVGALTTLIAYIADDKKWQAKGDELEALSATLVGYIDLKFPDWRTASPERFLVLGLIGYVTPRVGILEKQPIKDNPYKDWFRKLWAKFKSKKPTEVQVEKEVQK